MFFHKKVSTAATSDVVATLSTAPKAAALYWDTYFQKQPILYAGRYDYNSKNKLGVDVKSFIMPREILIQEVIKKHKLAGQNADDSALNVQKWAISFLKYKSDDQEDNVPEFWSFPFETLQHPFCDCEDGAILIASILIGLGVPSDRVCVAAGMVQPDVTAPEGGHAYCLYKASDNEWRVIDWCFFPDPAVPVLQKPLAKHGGFQGKYKNVWFAFNDQDAWSDAPTTATARVAVSMHNVSENLLESIVAKI
jgi:hypothetical protein